MPTTPESYTATETQAMNRAQRLVRSAVGNDSITPELFDDLLKNYNDITTICVEARRARTNAKKYWRRLFPKK